MGKKRVIQKGGSGGDHGSKERSADRLPKRKVSSGTVFVNATNNNTYISVADEAGGTIMWSSAGSLGFTGARKGTPYAASKVAELLADKGEKIGLKEVAIVIRGVGSGRESAVRTFATRGFVINAIKDVTPIPHNGPKRRKPRRV